MYEILKKVDSQVYQSVRHEISRQRNQIELIASENFAPLAVLEAAASPLTNKYAEGYPKARWYGGCQYIDEAEDLARARVKELFGAEHANVQPHSGTQANMAVLLAMLAQGETILAMDLACGGHLSHGHPLNFSGKFYNVISYGVHKESEQLDYDEILHLAVTHKPKLIIAGASAYPRTIDFARFREIADKVGAYLMVDMAHFAGMVAAGIYCNPVEYAEFVTSTTHKTLRGPRGGFILCRKEFAKKIDTAVFPGIQGGPLMHIIAAKAVGFGLSLTDEFKTYQKNLVANAIHFSDCLSQKGLRIVSGGTDTHLFLVDLRSKGLTGKECAHLLEEVNITVNKNLIPYDSQPPLVTSGIRIGTPAVTSRGMGKEEMEKLAQAIDQAITHKADQEQLDEVRRTVAQLVDAFPLYPEITMD